VSKISIAANINILKLKIIHDKKEVDYPLSKTHIFNKRDTKKIT
jgi:hypothetical protein